jgi:hypothetical protein
MKKNIIIGINIFVLVLGIGGFIFWKMNQKEPVPVNNPNTIFPFGGNSTTTTTPTPTTIIEQTNTVPEGMIKIKAKDGGYVIMKDFYQSPYTQILDQQKDASIKDSIDYNIEFQPEILGFLIDLRGKDLCKARENSEQGLLDKLGITKEEACRLYVDLGVIFSVNAKASGVNYGLSFCPEGKPLPKNL